MFFFKKSKPDVTTVGAAVGAPLVKQAKFPDVQTPRVQPAVIATERIFKGIPPQATYTDEEVPDEAKIGFIVEGTARHPPLAVVNAEYRAEIWELEDTAKPVFARKREVRFDPKQDNWAIYSVSQIACLPNDRLLLGVVHHAPVRYGLYVYDIAANSCSKLSDVDTLGQTPRVLLEDIDMLYASHTTLFGLLAVSPDELLVLFYTGRQRLAAEVYYATPGHIYAFSPEHPDGTLVLKLSAADGVVEGWRSDDKTLWLATQDFRDRKDPRSYAMSLDLNKLFTH